MAAVLLADAFPFMARSTPSLMVPMAQEQSCSPAPQAAVGGTLTDQEREAAIRLAGKALLRHMESFRKTGDSRSYALAHTALQLQNKLVMGRSPSMVRQMELARGLA